MSQGSYGLRKRPTNDSIASPLEEKEHNMIPLNTLAKNRGNHNTEAGETSRNPSPNESFDSHAVLAGMEGGGVDSKTTNRCPSTFLTQLQVLSGREWRNLKRYVGYG